MLRSNTASLLASAAVLLAGTGCITDDVGLAPGVLGVADAIAPQPPGQELHRMFFEEKRDAASAELPAQF